MRVSLLAEAERDIEDAHARYEEERPGRGHRFVFALDECLQRISEHPNVGPVVAIGHDERRALVIGFPYLVYYALNDDHIDVFAVLHTRREPQTWRARR